MGSSEFVDMSVIDKYGSGIAAEHTVESVKLLPREEVCRIWRFAPSGYLQNGEPVSEAFVARFKELGGFSPEISKRLGWEGD